MKVEKVLTIDGHIVEKEFQKGNIVVYKDTQHNDDTVTMLYFVNSQTEEVMFEQDLKQPEVQIKHNGNEVTVQDIKHSFTSPRLEKAIKKLQDMSHEEYKEFLSKHKNIPIDANTKPC